MNTISKMFWTGLTVTSLMLIGCSNTPESTGSAPPPAKTAPAAESGSAPAANTSAAPASGAPSSPTAAATVGPDGQPLAGLAEMKGKKDPIPNNATTLAQGKEIFTKNCAPCHGTDGKGDGPQATTLDPKPRDFTSGMFQFGHEDWQVFRTAEYGVGGTGMAGWKGRLSDNDIWTVVHYVKSLSGQK